MFLIAFQPPMFLSYKFLLRFSFVIILFVSEILIIVGEEMQFVGENFQSGILQSSHENEGLS